MSLASPFSKLFTALQARIKSQVPEIIWIDHDLGQLEAFDGERPPVEWPCLLIDFIETPFTQMQGYQDGDVSIQLRLAFNQYQQTHSDVPEYVKEQALQYYEIEHKVHLALQAWTASNTLVNALIRRSAASEKREEDNFRVRRIVYQGSFSDSSVTG
jgi:hypothetical protein